MTLGKQARTLSDAQVRAALAAVKTPSDRLMILFSVKAGLRACEIASITWPMVLDSEGRVSDVIALQSVVTKGKKGGREIPMHPDIRAVLSEVQAGEGQIVRDPKGRRYRAGTIAKRFERLYRSLGFQGCSSHSGRRTFITRGARKITEAGGSLRDIQQMAGHSSLSTTQAYIEGSSDAKRRVVSMI